LLIYHYFPHFWFLSSFFARGFPSSQPRIRETLVVKRSQLAWQPWDALKLPAMATKAIHLFQSYYKIPGETKP
jgi:hypothetical protein